MKDREQELWACALWVEKHQGGNAMLIMGEQVRRPALKGEEAGIATWPATANRINS